MKKYFNRLVCVIVLLTILAAALPLTGCALNKKDPKPVDTVGDFLARPKPESVHN